jgi:tripartite-type tricarboxylate transporter receptor subunit TctC
VPRAQGKQIDVAAVNIGESMQAIKGGAPFRNLGQMSARRTELAADVPTFKEQGYNIEMSSLRGIAAPKGLPADVRERLVKAVAQTTSDPEFLKVAAGLFTQMRYLNPDQYRTVLRDTEAGFRKLWTETALGREVIDQRVFSRWTAASISSTPFTPSIAMSRDTSCASRSMACATPRSPPTAAA